ncbi:hypothetical protein DPEC_G00242980 [Dallia pectoralis]|uniref:Uncharacterized protein n=1 Tax=Dallia pectoralis TaxID=75939 RepID=A0ACC2FV55_DALPE|nr:hypothetical protein DPEC_G00242980 [Dallia pectoralis]
MCDLLPIEEDQSVRPAHQIHPDLQRPLSYRVTSLLHREDRRQNSETQTRRLDWTSDPHTRPVPSRSTHHNKPDSVFSGL